MSKDTKDAKDASDQQAKTLYDLNAAATPLPPPMEKNALYSWSPAVEVVKQAGPDLYAKTGMTTREQEHLQNSFRDIQRSTGLPDGVLAKVAEGVVANRFADARVVDDPDADDLALSQRIAASNAELREHFIRQYGATDGAALLDRTARFIRRHPTLARMLQERGLGSDPEIVKGVAGHIFSIGFK